MVAGRRIMTASIGPAAIASGCDVPFRTCSTAGTATLHRCFPARQTKRIEKHPATGRRAAGKPCPQKMPARTAQSTCSTCVEHINKSTKAHPTNTQKLLRNKPVQPQATSTLNSQLSKIVIHLHTPPSANVTAIFVHITNTRITTSKCTEMEKDWSSTGRSALWPSSCLSIFESACVHKSLKS